MKQIIISMELGKIEAKARWDENERLTAFMGCLEISPEAHDNLMSAEQISGFLDSVVWPRLQGFAREIETEQNEIDEAKLIESGEE